VTGPPAKTGRRRRASAALAATLAVVAPAACTPSDDDEASLARGRDHYLAQCSSCHQPDGKGFAQIYPNLAGNPIVRLEDPDEVIEIVLHGRGAMPSFNHRAADELAEIISYIRHDWGNGASPVTPSQVK
jgi:mono/diheme cytochrome c family protein